jgi:hypothetical protein
MLFLILQITIPIYAEKTPETRIFNIPALQEDFVEGIHSFPPEQPAPDSILSLEAKIIALADKVREQNNLITNLDPSFQVKYPLGIFKEIGGLTYIIVLESDEITPQGAFVNAYMHFITPQGKSLSFAANKIPLSASGGLNGIVELALIKDETIDLGNMNFHIYGQTSTGVGRTKIHFDCGGFIDMVIDAGIEFSKNVFVKENAKTGEQLNNEPFIVNFITTFQSWSDLIVDISLPPFQLKSLKGFGFEASQISFDFSDLNNPAGIVFPSEYPGLLMFGDFKQLWQGLYIRQAVLRLPPELNKGERIQIVTRNLIVDQTGITGAFAAENLLSIDKGEIGGWAFSLDKVEINLLCNSLTRAGLAGKINLPIMKETKTIAYAAMVDYKGDFLFSVSMPEGFDVPMFKANMLIDRSSTITIHEINDKFSVIATLNGSISISAPVGSKTDSTDYDKQKKGLSLSGLKFEQMILSTTSPHFKPGMWSVNEIGYKGSGLNGFAISLSDIEAKESPSGNVGIGFKGRVNFSGNKYCASSTLTLWAEQKLVNERSRYVFKSTEIHEIYLKVDDAAISIEGYFAVYKDDPKYGDGFAAKVKAKFLVIGLSATAMFGEVNDFKYFYIDALADLSKTPITMGAVAFYGFGGGAYSHMRQIPPEGNPLAATKNSSNSKPIINYEPDKSTLFGFKATVVLGTAGNPTAFNARVTFEMNFNENGGIKNVMFYGAGYFMTKLDVLNDNQTGPIYGTAFIGYDVDNKIFHSNLKVFVNVGGGLIQGINPGYLAGEAVIHVDPQDWYIHIGRPATRVGLKISILGISIINGSYFMMGTKIDEMPPPPDKVLEILGTKVAARPGGDLSLKGFCFGTSFAISTGELKLFIFYAKFDMGLGFDVILADRTGYVCAYNGEEPGINGWYAEGQVYAYVEGDIGIKVEIFTKKIKASILKIGAATLLEAKLPNPFWMRGQVGGYYRIFGGAIKGNCKFKFELGKLCEFVTVSEPESAVKGLTVISDITPEDGRQEIDVFNAPQAVFNYQINKSFSISEDISNATKYKIILDHFKISAGGNELAGTYEWNTNGDVLVFNPHDILPGKTKIDISTQIHFEELVGNVWQPVLDSNMVITEAKTISFVTGVAPDYIAENNVKYGYPVRKMMNFYKNEYASGYIQLKQGQEYLFLPSDEFKQFVRFTPAGGGAPLYMNFRYLAGDKKIDHQFPASLLNNTMYKLEVVNIPTGSAGTIDQNIQSVTTSSESEAGDMQKTENKAVGELTIPGEKTIYELYFRTSMYNTFHDKVQNLNVPQGYTYPIAQGIYKVGCQVNGNELFDDLELNGTDGLNPLIQFTADESGPWLKNHAYPIIYADYPINNNITIKWRNTDDLGVVPLKAIDFKYSSANSTLLNTEEFGTGNKVAMDFSAQFIYKLNILAVYDWDDIIVGAFRAPVYTSRIALILNSQCPAILFNTSYPIKVTYTLPGIDKTTGSSIIQFKVL